MIHVKDHKQLDIFNPFARLGHKHLKLPKGFYGALHILVTLGFMALGRIRRPEGLRHVPPG